MNITAFTVYDLVLFSVHFFYRILGISAPKHALHDVWFDEL